MELTACMRDTIQRMIASLPLPVYPSPGKIPSFGKPHSLPSKPEGLGMRDYGEHCVAASYFLCLLVIMHAVCGRSSAASLFAL